MVRVYPIIEPRDVVESPDAVAGLIKSGIKMLQLRGSSGREMLESGRLIAASCRMNGVSLIVNDRADIAQLLGVGVHVGQEDLTVADARKLLGPHAVIGLSTHNESEARAALGSGADYISIGPIYSTNSKPDAAPVVGPSRLRKICDQMKGQKPDPVIVAVGGINQYNYQICIDHGAMYVAAIGAFRDDNGRLHMNSGAIAAKMI